ncbi:MAG: phosphate acetyltransferase [Butyrivibrio sp.]|nr:phosphate acetyltransferase [Butyrivibrio sp.]
MTFIEEIKAKAKADKKRIVLPEGMDRRIWEAAATIVKEDLAEITVIATPDETAAYSKGIDTAGINIINPFKSDRLERYVADLTELRRKKGMTSDEARTLLTTDYVHYACMMLREDEADGVVSGACHSTANTLRPALQIVKAKPGVKLVSAFFIIVVPDCPYGSDGTFLFGDCGLEQNPDSDRLASIAVDSARSFQKLVGREPIVALLSHSTMGSARHPDVDKVTNAVKIARHMAPDIKLDGEMQLDAAIIPEVAELKAPVSKVAGRANVLIFPDLDSGNIGYKLVHRLAKAEAYGPVTQGIAKPVNDLSRGCSPSDVVGVVALTAVQSQLQI